jgi:hypothetical protein
MSADPDSLLGDAKRSFRIAEDVDDVDGLLDVGKRGMNLLAEDLLARLAWIDRDHAESLRLQIFHGKIARPRRVGARSHHGDGAVGDKDVANVSVAIDVVVHGACEGEGG